MMTIRRLAALALLLACADAFAGPTPGFLPRPSLRAGGVGAGRAPLPLQKSERRPRAGALALPRASLADPREARLRSAPAPLPFPIDAGKLGAQLIGACAALSLLLGGPVVCPPEVALAAPATESAIAVIKPSGKVEEKVVELDPEVQDKVQVFAEILNDITASYVDPVDLTKITETGFNAMLQSLDPYTEFENPKATESMRTTTSGNYGGVGLAISKLRDPAEKEEPYVYVMQAFEGFAFDAGIRVGDKIVKVDGKDVKDATVTEVSEMLRGKRGTEVKVMIERPGQGTFDKVLNRRQVPLRDVPVALLIDDKNEIGYLKLSGFSQTGPLEMAFVLNNMQKQAPNLKAVILDLRGNTGGLLSSAIKVADFFLPDGVTVVSTKGRVVETQDGEVVKETKSMAKATASYKADQIKKYIGNAPDGRPLFSDEPLIDSSVRLVVLTDRLTASASEIVAGAVQDHDRGIVMGETTYGKGLVQQLQRLSGGRQIKFTSGKYYTPSGRCIQSKVYAAAQDGRGTKEDKIQDKDRKIFYTDNGRPVRDGGGIEPDVPLPPPKIGQLEMSLNRWDAFFKFSGELAKDIKNGEALANLESPMVSDEMYDKFQKYVIAKTDPNSLSYGPFSKSLELFKDALKEGGYDEAIVDVEGVQKHLNQLIIGEFKTNKESIKGRLELALRSRFVPDSKVLASAITKDKQIAEAVKYAENPILYAQTIKTTNPSTLAAVQAAKGAPAQ